ncbi:MAG: heparinase II/III-family protein [Clostridium sp.]|nr:MAG: heparinase II/III-family protein [Clostridium sp.]
MKNIEANPNPRTPLPLSKPYYIDNKFAYERLLLNTDYKYNDYIPVKQSTKNFPNSNYAMLRNDYLNVFVKYGLNGPSHAHPDLINVEVMYKNDRISRDLSNAGYQSKMCKEWHRMSLAHNTIIRNGENIPSTTKGDTISYNPCHIVCKHEDVYPGVCYTRDVEIKEKYFYGIII